MTIDQKNNYIIDHYGFENQSVQSMEENAEYTQALSKFRRAVNSCDPVAIVKAEENLVEEMADVLVMMSQIQYKLGISDERVGRVMEKKINRTYRRVQAEQLQQAGNERMIFCVLHGAI